MLYNYQLSGHLGIKNTKRLIRRNYNWFEITKDVKNYIKECYVYNQNKPINSKAQGLLQPLQLPEAL